MGTAWYTILNGARTGRSDSTRREGQTISFDFMTRWLESKLLNYQVPLTFYKSALSVSFSFSFFFFSFTQRDKCTFGLFISLVCVFYHGERGWYGMSSERSRKNGCQ